MDILYLGAMFPKKASIMAKKELSYLPFLGWWSESLCLLFALKQVLILDALFFV